MPTALKPRICTSCHEPFVPKPRTPGRTRVRCYKCRPERLARPDVPVQMPCAFCLCGMPSPRGHRWGAYCTERCAQCAVWAQHSGVPGKEAKRLEALFTLDANEVAADYRRHRAELAR
jgi:hypothetical protein